MTNTDKTVSPSDERLAALRLEFFRQSSKRGIDIFNALTELEDRRREASRTQSPAEWQVEDDVIDARFKLWFFRDISGDQRLALFKLCGMPAAEVGQTHSHQMVALKHLFRSIRAASITPPAPERSKEDVGVKAYVKRNMPGHADSGGSVVVPFSTDDEMRAILSALEPASLMPEAPKRVIGTIAHIDHGKTSLTAAVARVLAAEADSPAPLPVTITDGEEEHRIEDLRFKAFRTNDPNDRQAFFDAASKWFQDRHYRYAALSKPGEQG